jgi:hypothetical protein
LDEIAKARKNAKSKPLSAFENNWLKLDEEDAREGLKALK